MSLEYHLIVSSTIMPSEKEQLVQKLNELYEREVSKKRILKYSKYGINCEYALIDSQDLDYWKTKRAIGFGICFPKPERHKCQRMIIFKDLIPLEFLDVAIAHEFSHLDQKYKNKSGLLAEQFEVDEKNEKEAFALELKIAEQIGKKKEYLLHMKKEDSQRLNEFLEFDLISLADLTDGRVKSEC